MPVRRKRKHDFMSSSANMAEDDDEDDDEDDGLVPVNKARKSSTAKKGLVHQKKSNKKKDKKFRFLELPGEIRNKIYTLLLCEADRPIQIRRNWSREMTRMKVVGPKDKGYTLRYTKNQAQPAKHDIFVKNINVLRTCKKVYWEAMSILYGQKFTFLDMADVQYFMIHLRPDAIQLLRHIDCSKDRSSRLHYEAWSLMPSSAMLLRLATNLEYLRVPIEHFRFGFKVKSGFIALKSNMTVQDYDTVVGQNMAKEVYSQMHPYLRPVVREKGIEEVMSFLDVFYFYLNDGPAFIREGRMMTHGPKITAPNDCIKSAPWTPSRKSITCAAMKEEMARLVADDWL